MAATIYAGGNTNAPLDLAIKAMQSAAVLVAGTTRTQAGATPITTNSARVDTSTAPTSGSLLGDGVVLPAVAPGVYVFVHNNTNNPVQVYGNATDTINGVAGNIGITMPPNSVDTFIAAGAGAWAVEAGVGFAGQLNTVLSLDNIVANNTGTQAAATTLSADFNRIVTAANAAAPWSAVRLPASAPGMDIFVINHGANSIQVFGANTDRIDDVATATGVTQMPGSVTLYTCTTAGDWYSNGIGTGYAGSFPTVSYVNGLTANSGAVQAGATPVTACIARFTTVGGPGYSALLPNAFGGMQITVANAGANSINLFPAVGEQINALGVNTAFSIPVGKSAVLSCAVAGQWHSVLSA